MQKVRDKVPVQKDELMTGEGVWVRCGRCGSEFFENNTRQGVSAPPAKEAVKEKPDLRRTRGGSNSAAR